MIVLISVARLLFVWFLQALSVNILCLRWKKDGGSSLAASFITTTRRRSSRITTTTTTTIGSINNCQVSAAAAVPSLKPSVSTTTALCVASSRQQVEEEFTIVSSRVIKEIPLPIVIYYIQTYFQLPTNLPMPFHPENNNNNNSNNNSNIIQTWVCPLAPQDSKIYVEVIGLRRDDDEILPSMSMVAVKTKQQISSPLIQGTQKLILRALDCALDDLLFNANTQEQVLQRHILETQQEEDSRATSTTSTAESQTPPKDIISYYKQNKKNPTKIIPSVDSSTSTTTSTSINIHPVSRTTDIYSTIQNPKGYSSRSGTSNEVILDVDATDIPIVTPPETDKQSSTKHRKNTATTKMNNVVTEKQVKKKEKQRQKVTDTTAPNATEQKTPPTNSTISTATNNIPFDQNPFLNITNLKELLQSDADDEDENSSSVTPEELAQQVMEFGRKQKEEEENTSFGFAKSAFTTAKELLKKEKPKTAATTSLPLDEVDISKEEEELRQLMGAVEEKEELRKIFEAGERLANTRLVNQRREQRRSKEEEEALERLLQADKTVPRATANDILEEELAQLQLRIRVDDNDSDEPKQKDILDLFQGPPPKEYNDPALDWPGSPSQQQQQKQKLPASLEEAVTQAKFASQMLLQLVKKEDGKFYRRNKEDEEVPLSQVKLLCKCVQEAVEVGLIGNPIKLLEEQSRLELVLAELSNSSDRFDDVVSGFKDLVVSDNFVPLIRKRLNEMAKKEGEIMEEKLLREVVERHERDRENLSKLVNYAMILLKETQSLGAELEAMQLELIRSICEVAMDPRYSTEEEAVIALSDAVRDMRPLLDENFVAYLKYAIAEEEGRLRRRGLLDDMNHSSWLMVLKIIQGGVYAELAKSVQRHVDTILYVLRMDTKKRRRRLLELFVNDLPSLDVRPFRKVVDNIVGSLGTVVRAGGGGDSEMTRILGGMVKEILQLASDIKEVLPPERVAQKAKDADEWIKSQRQKISQLQEERRQRLRAKKAEKEEAMGISTTGSQFDVDPLDEIGS